MSRLKRPDASVNGQGPFALSDPEFVREYPVLFEYLTGNRWEDGKPRETATLLFFAEDGIWKACLNDRALGRTGWASEASFVALLHRIETELAADSVDWRRRQKGR